jgi:single-strand DNA-binding protein
LYHRLKNKTGEKTMLNLAKVQIGGNLTKKPELSATPAGTAVCLFSLAVKRTRKEEKADPLFIDVYAWGTCAKNCVKYLAKGSTVFVDGRLEMDKWKDKETGKPRSRHFVNAFDVQFVSSPGAHNTESKQVIPDVSNLNAPEISPGVAE